MIETTNNFSPFKRQWHLCYYIPQLRNDDFLSSRILAFKNSEQNAKQQWLSWSSNELSNIGIQFDYIIRSLGHDELESLNNSPLDNLGILLERTLNSHYQSSLLKKRRVTRKLSTIPTIFDRRAELKDVFYCTNEKNLNNKNVLLIDDVSTSGVTSNFIYQSIVEINPLVNCYLFTLAQTSRDEFANSSIICPFANDSKQISDDLPF